MGAVKKNVVKKKFDGVYNIILKDNFNLIYLNIYNKFELEFKIKKNEKTKFK